MQVLNFQPFCQVCGVVKFCPIWKIISLYERFECGNSDVIVWNHQSNEIHVALVCFVWVGYCHYIQHYITLWLEQATLEIIFLKFFHLI